MKIIIEVDGDISMVGEYFEALNIDNSLIKSIKFEGDWKMNQIKEILGESPSVKVIDFLVQNSKMDYTMSEIIKGSTTGRKQAYSVIKKLINYKIIIITRKVGSSNFYQLDKTNINVKLIIRLINSVEKWLQKL